MKFSKPRCYILYSKTGNSFYIGYTTQQLQTRLDQHNMAHFGQAHFTAKFSDWELHFQIECESTQQAVQIESHIKRMKSRKYLEDLKKYPQIVEKLKARYSV